MIEQDEGTTGGWNGDGMGVCTRMGGLKSCQQSKSFFFERRARAAAAAVVGFFSFLRQVRSGKSRTSGAVLQPVPPHVPTLAGPFLKGGQKLLGC